MVIYIYIWCDQYESLLITLSGLKEYDGDFCDKIKINKNYFYGKTDKYSLNIFLQRDFQT